MLDDLSENDCKTCAFCDLRCMVNITVDIVDGDDGRSSKLMIWYDWFPSIRMTCVGPVMLHVNAWNLLHH